MRFPSKALRHLCPLLAATACLVTFSTSTLAQNSLYQEQGQLIRAPRALGVLGENLFGDSVNYYNGALSFSQTDVSLPGNNALSMAVTRTFNTGSTITTKGLFGHWELDIPHLSGTFSKIDGWTGTNPAGRSNQRCTYFGTPRDAAGTSGDLGNSARFAPREFWHGNFINLPGAGSAEILRRNPANNNVPQDGNSYPLVTKNLWALRCLPSLANPGSNPDGVAAGEGFLAVAPDGTQYRFDWLAQRDTNSLSKSTLLPLDLSSPTVPVPSESSVNNAVINTVINTAIDTGEDPAVIAKIGSLLRVEVRLLPTLITDKYGNTITYRYDSTDPWKLLSMVASDGRTLSFTYLPNTRQIETVSDDTRTWRYNYINSATAGPILSQVINPDNSHWQLDSIENLAKNLKHAQPPDCDNPGTLNINPVSASLTHPSGAVGTFTLTPTLHGRSQVINECIEYGTGSIGETGRFALYPRYFDHYSLTQKTLSGPGLPTMTWHIGYSPAAASWDSCPTCVDLKTTTVTDPKGDISRYTFGTRFRVNEGLLLQTDSGFNGNTALRTTTLRYRAANAGPNSPYANPLGYSAQNRGDADMSAQWMPQEQRITTQQGVSFNWNATAFDSKARATAITRANSLGFVRSEQTVYTDIASQWVLGLVASVTETSTGLVMQSNTYDATNGNLLSMKRFGHLEDTHSYNSDGTLNTKTDGLGYTTTFGNYKRGLAQSVNYADNTSESATVNNIGLITATTDAMGFTTTYGYDVAGRLNRISYPTGDSNTWNDTTITTEQVNFDEFGLSNGHWKQTVATGNGISVSYLDGFWRPMLGRSYDATNESTTRKVILRKFDHKGQTLFESYPQRDIASISATPPGTATQYDALNRPTQIDTDSELGKLTTRHEYLNNFQKRITNPRGNRTTHSYQVFDEPSENALTALNQPESVNLTITRDVFDKPKTLTRSGPGGAGSQVSATRSYIYDAKQRLCKTIEPEIGATVQTYDAANNTAWRASGLNLPSANCDDASVPAANKVSYTYNTRHRLTATDYGDGSPGITRSYTPDGLPQTITSSGLTWRTTYNRRRLPVQESLPVDNNTYTLSASYNANAHLAQFTYPNGLVITHAPNALGEPSQVGQYASNISYHPNGAIAGFSYGNGIVHSLTQNTRNLPTQSKDTGILSDVYSFDANGNVVGISDQQENITSRSMSYDGLDRLSSANAPSLWGMANYTYDALDNLRNSTVGSRSSNHTFDLGGTNRLLSISSNGSVSNYLYDAQGNITQRGAQGFKFDLANRMSAATGKASYIYDGLGHRTKILASDGSSRIQIYSPAGQLLYATQSATAGKPAAATTTYIYLHHGLIAEVNQ